MELWLQWWRMVKQLRPACTRLRTFLWLVTCLVGITVRGDLLGVTSIVRALGLKGFYYDRVLDFFHTTALNLEKLTQLWESIILKCPVILRINGRILLVGDGLKVPKEGKKMPAVKKLYQESQSNTKPQYIFGHYCQAVALLAGTLNNVFAIPLTSRIHEGIVFSNRDTRTSLDKMIQLINSLCIQEAFYFIADAYYASKTMVFGLLATGNHLITRVKSNAVAYLPMINTSSDKKRTRGRPRKYAGKIKLREYFNNIADMQTVQSPIYGDKNVKIRFRTIDLLWRPVGVVVRFVVVIHTTRGKIILMSTDLTLPPIEIIRIYGLRFKIELSFKQALHILGTYAYHFWMKVVDPIRKNSGDQYLHRESSQYRAAVRRKLNAYHIHIQIGIIAQGLVQYLSLCFPELIWSFFGSWVRTLRPGIYPSERITVTALRNSLPDFLTVSLKNSILAKFLINRVDFCRIEGIRLVT